MQACPATTSNRHVEAGRRRRRKSIHWLLHVAGSRANENRRREEFSSRQTSFLTACPAERAREREQRGVPRAERGRRREKPTDQTTPYRYATTPEEGRRGSELRRRLLTCHLIRWASPQPGLFPVFQLSPPSVTLHASRFACRSPLSLGVLRSSCLPRTTISWPPFMSQSPFEEITYSEASDGRPSVRIASRPNQTSLASPIGCQTACMWLAGVVEFCKIKRYQAG